MLLYTQSTGARILWRTTHIVDRTPRRDIPNSRPRDRQTGTTATIAAIGAGITAKRRTVKGNAPAVPIHFGGDFVFAATQKLVLHIGPHHVGSPRCNNGIQLNEDEATECYNRTTPGLGFHLSNVG